MTPEQQAEQQAQQQQQQPQDPTPLIRALQQQRNHALDQLADAQASHAVTAGNLQGLSEAFGKMQSAFDDTSTQLETTKAALAEVQARATSLDASNVALTKKVSELQVRLPQAVMPV